MITTIDTSAKRHTAADRKFEIGMRAFIFWQPIQSTGRGMRDLCLPRETYRSGGQMSTKRLGQLRGGLLKCHAVWTVDFGGLQVARIVASCDTNLH
jgi:hypothetical protein